MKIRITILFLIALPVFAADEMRKLDFLVGDWKGEASVSSGPGKGEQVLQTETVRTKLGGKALLIEGTGKKKFADGSAGDVVHDAVGMVWFDEAMKKYRFSAWTAARGYVDAWFEVEDNKAARWGFDTPDGGKVRFTIALDDEGRWREVGEYSPDGNRWFKTMEMKLTKVK
ncbi:MAG: hypothetical protein ACXW5U_31290 [Thermoanaerobaculia bacterium]